MVDIEVLEQSPIAAFEMKNKLESIKQQKGGLNFRAEKVYVYLEEFAEKNVDSVYKKLSELGISKLRDRQIVKIVDVMPRDIESLKAIFVGEVSTLKQDDLQKVIEIING